MPVTKDVILDLLPLYCAGEAAADTRALVEEHLRADASLAAHAAEIRRALRAVEIGSPRARSSDADLNALRKVRGDVRLRGWLLGISIWLTCFVFSFRFDSHGFDWTWSKFPAGAAVSGLLALAGWISYFRVRRRLGV